MTYRQNPAHSRSGHPPHQRSALIRPAWRRSALPVCLAAAFLSASLAGAGTARGASGFTFDDVNSEDAQAIETFLETATTESENSLPSGRGTMMVVNTVTDPAICREFVVNLSDAGQKSANGCRTGSGSWALADGNAALDGEPLMIPPPGSRPDVASDASVPARLAGVPTIDIPQMALTPPQLRPEDPSDAATSGNDAAEDGDAAGSNGSGAEAPPAFAALTPLQRPDTIREIENPATTSTDAETTAASTDAVPAELAGFPSPEPRPSEGRPPSPPASATQDATSGADDGAEPEATASSPAGDDSPSIAARAETIADPPSLRPVPESLNNFPQPQLKPSS